MKPPVGVHAHERYFLWVDAALLDAAAIASATAWRARTRTRVSSKSDTGSGKLSWFGFRTNRVVNEPSGPHRAVAGLGVFEVIAIPPESRHDFLAPMLNRNNRGVGACCGQSLPLEWDDGHTGTSNGATPAHMRVIVVNSCQAGLKIAHRSK